MFHLQSGGTLQIGLHSVLNAVADAKHPLHEEALSGVKASRACLMNQAESRKKEVTQGTFTTKKVNTLPDDAIDSKLEAALASALKVDYGLAARTAKSSTRVSYERKWTMGEVLTGKYRVARETGCPGEDSERRRQPGTQEMGFEVECHHREDHRYEKWEKQDNVDQIGRG